MGPGVSVTDVLERTLDYILFRTQPVVDRNWQDAVVEQQCILLGSDVFARKHDMTTPMYRQPYRRLSAVMTLPRGIRSFLTYSPGIVLFRLRRVWQVDVSPEGEHTISMLENKSFDLGRTILRHARKLLG